MDFPTTGTITWKIKETKIISIKSQAEREGGRGGIGIQTHAGQRERDTSGMCWQIMKGQKRRIQIP